MSNETKYWAILFDDQDRRPEIFTDEQAAMRRYEQISASWNAHLLVKVHSNSLDAAERATSADANSRKEPT